MPSKSKKQHRLMEAVKHNPKFAKKVGIPQSVGADFVAADKATGRYAVGGAIEQTLAQVRPVPDIQVPKLSGIVSQADHTMARAGARLSKLKTRGRKQDGDFR